VGTILATVHEDTARPSRPYSYDHVSILETENKAVDDVYLEGQSSLGTGVVRFGLWRNSLVCLALYKDDVDKHTLELLNIAF
jgi:hypothetical protein